MIHRRPRFAVQGLTRVQLPGFLTVDVVEEPKPNEIPFDLGANLTAVLNRGTLLTDIVA